MNWRLHHDNDDSSGNEKNYQNGDKNFRCENPTSKHCHHSCGDDFILRDGGWYITNHDQHNHHYKYKQLNILNIIQLVKSSSPQLQ